MESENIQYITLDGGQVLPMVAVPVTTEQRSYNPVLDHEAPDLELEAMLSRAGLQNYATLIINDHGIESAREFSELYDSDIKLFCRVARDRVLFRKLLANLVRILIL